MDAYITQTEVIVGRQWNAVWHRCYLLGTYVVHLQFSPTNPELRQNETPQSSPKGILFTYLRSGSLYRYVNDEPRIQGGPRTSRWVLFLVLTESECRV